MRDAEPPRGPAESAAPEPPVVLPIDGVLDLHAFQPREVKALVLDYLSACQDAGIVEMRIVHGKGLGALKRTVHAVLARHAAVVSFSLEHELFGGWGATVVKLRRASGRRPPDETATL